MVEVPALATTSPVMAVFFVLTVRTGVRVRGCRLTVVNVQRGDVLLLIGLAFRHLDREDVGIDGDVACAHRKSAGLALNSTFVFRQIDVGVDVKLAHVEGCFGGMLRICGLTHKGGALVRRQVDLAAANVQLPAVLVDRVSMIVDGSG